MSDVDSQNGVPDFDMLAAEYVLGVLTAAERRDVERRAVRDAFFARALREWENRLLPWADSVEPVTAPEQVWRRILAALPAQPLLAREPRSSWLRSLAVWRGLAIGATALAAASIVALFVVIRAPAPEPLTASIDGGGHRHFIATVDTQHGRLLVSPAAFAAVQGRVPELWLIAPGSAPKSLGLLSADRPVTIAIPADLLAQTNAQAVLAVTLEPPGGAPGGVPTSPPIAQGKLASM